MNFLDDPHFIEDRLNGRCHLFKNIQHELPTWNDVIENLNVSIENDWFVKYLDNFGFVTHNAEEMPLVNSLLKYISTLDPNVPSSAHCYFSLTKNANTFGRHNDPSDVFFWQIIGKTQWTVENPHNKIIHILEPNDLLFVPRGLWHDTKPLTARAGISFGLDY